MEFLNRKTIDYLSTQVGRKYKDSRIGNLWLPILFMIRVLVIFFIMGGGKGESIPSYLFYITSGFLFFELFKDFCAQCLDAKNESKRFPFTWDIRYYYLMCRGYVLTFEAPFLVLTALICKVNIISFFFYMGLGLVVFSFWLYHLATILMLISHKTPELKVLSSIALGHLLFLTPIFWSADYSSSYLKNLLCSVNPLAYMLDIPRYAILPIRWDRFCLTVGILIVTYIVSQFLQYKHGDVVQEEVNS